MLKIGLTGGIASGKSTVAAAFEKLGAPVIYADKVSREVVAVGSEGLSSVQHAFGKEILKPSGELDRSALRKIVFADPVKRQRLESILHPLIRNRSDEMEEVARASGALYLVFEIPLLLETGRYKDMDRVIVVDVPEEIQITRVIQRDNCSEAQAKKILAAQSNRVERLGIATDVISNNSGIDALETVVFELHERFLRLYNSN